MRAMLLPLPLLVLLVRADDAHHPWRRTTLHFTQIFLTDDLTFTV